jgi:hypothetical protein
VQNSFWLRVVSGTSPRWYTVRDISVEILLKQYTIIVIVKSVTLICLISLPSVQVQ